MNLPEKPLVRSVSDDPINDGGNSQRAMKARQTQKIDQIRQIFLSNGRPINQQAGLLGLCRSTAYAVLRRDYKHSGLTAAIIKRMLSSSDLPASARNIIHEYIAEKSAGVYGHSRAQRRRFLAALVTDLDSRVDTNGPVRL